VIGVDGREQVARQLYLWGENGGGYREPTPWEDLDDEQMREDYREAADRIIDLLAAADGHD
jgi:hypothetical protein